MKFTEFHRVCDLQRILSNVVYDYQLHNSPLENPKRTE